MTEGNLCNIGSHMDPRREDDMGGIVLFLENLTSRQRQLGFQGDISVHVLASEKESAAQDKREEHNVRKNTDEFS